MSEDKSVDEKIQKIKDALNRKKIGITKIDNNILPEYIIKKHKKDKDKTRKKNKQQKLNRKKNR